MLIRIAQKEDIKYIPTLLTWYEESAKKRGIGIAKRSAEYLEKCIENKNALIAFHQNRLAGFCYIEVYEDEKFVVNSGLIVHPDYREYGVGRKIKLEVFKLSRKKFPKAKIFGITTNLSVMRMNTKLGYEPVTFSELTDSDTFWNGCKSCKYFHILNENDRKMCLCTGLVYDPEKQESNEIDEDEFLRNKK